jgi:hypothetical protein
MHETWSWHAYSYALGFLQKVGCDSPPVPGSFVPWFDSSLLSFVLPRVLQGIVPKTWGWSITSLSWRLVCDSIHRSCVTGNCLGYRPGSLRRIFTGSYSLPPSSRNPILHSYSSLISGAGRCKSTRMMAFVKHWRPLDWLPNHFKARGLLCYTHHSIFSRRNIQNQDWPSARVRDSI